MEAGKVSQQFGPLKNCILHQSWLSIYNVGTEKKGSHKKGELVFSLSQAFDFAAD